MVGIPALILGADQLTEAFHPGDPLVAEVPHQGQTTAGAQHPGDLRQRAGGVEPVEGLGADDHVDRAGAHRDSLSSGQGCRRAG